MTMFVHWGRKIRIKRREYVGERKKLVLDSVNPQLCEMNPVS